MSDEDVSEDIVIKPSIELIADEYEHFKEATANIPVHTFCSKSKDDQESVRLLTENLNKNGYLIVEENQHCLDTDDFEEIMQTILRDSQNSEGLILYFSGICKKEGAIRVYDGKQMIFMRIQEVVKRFSSYKCTGLKNKPKIFFFHIKSTSHVQTDSVMRTVFSYDLTYDTPAEADMLIIYKKTDYGNPVDFVTKLCDFIDKYGKVEDIVTLITCLEDDINEPRPIVVSTLTRKFYFTPSEYRGHHFHIHHHHNKLKDHLGEIRNKLSSVKLKKKPIATNKSTVKTTANVRNGTARNVPSVTTRPLSKVSTDSSPTSGARESKTKLDGGSLGTARNRLSSVKSDSSLSAKSKTDISSRPPWKI